MTTRPNPDIVAPVTPLAAFVGFVFSTILALAFLVLMAQHHTPPPLFAVTLVALSAWPIAFYVQFRRALKAPR